MLGTGSAAPLMFGSPSGMTSRFNCGTAMRMQSLTEIAQSMFWGV
jgi:hypothetical protein